MKRATIADSRCSRARRGDIAMLHVVMAAAAVALAACGGGSDGGSSSGPQLKSCDQVGLSCASSKDCCGGDPFVCMDQVCRSTDLGMNCTQSSDCLGTDHSSDGHGSEVHRTCEEGICMKSMGADCTPSDPHNGWCASGACVASKDYRCDVPW